MTDPKLPSSVWLLASRNLLFCQQPVDLMKEKLPSLSKEVLPASSVILRTGQTPKKLYLVVDGWIEAFVKSTNYVTRDFGPGHVIFLSSVLRPVPSVLEYHTTRPTAVLSVNTEEVLRYAFTSSSFMRSLLTEIAKQEQELMDRLSLIIGATVEDKIDHFMWQYPDVTNDHMIKQEIARRVGSTRESVSKVFARRAADGSLDKKLSPPPTTAMSESLHSKSHPAYRRRPYLVGQPRASKPKPAQ